MAGRLVAQGDGPLLPGGEEGVGGGLHRVAEEGGVGLREVLAGAVEALGLLLPRRTGLLRSVAVHIWRVIRRPLRRRGPSRCGG